MAQKNERLRPDDIPAFPREDYQADDAPGQRGMSLRDYFAASALSGLLARSDSAVPHCETCLPVKDDPGAHYADIAYRYADAMLKVRAEAR